LFDGNKIAIFDETWNIAENKLYLPFYFDFNVENKKLYCVIKNCNNQTNPNHIALVRFLF